MAVTAGGDPTTEPRRATRWLLAAGLFLLAPMSAEYVTAYDPDSTGDPVALLGGLLILGPLYGAPALLIRETARRFGLRWPGVLALAAAFGLVQAGVVDQSLFSASYRDLEGWDDMLLPTFIEPLGLGAYLAMIFVVGHAVWSFCVPIALVEAALPAMSARPWLHRSGLVVMTLLYLAAAALIIVDHLRTESDHASAAQIAACLLVAAVLVLFAGTAGRQPMTARTDTRVPRPWVIGVVSLVAAFGFNIVPPPWWGVAVAVALLTTTGVCVSALSRSGRWHQGHVVALATGALSARALIGFFSLPEGVATEAKYAHNAVFLVGALLLGVWVARRQRGDGQGGAATMTS